MNDDILQKLEQELEVLSQTHRNDMIADVARRILALNPKHEAASFRLVLAVYGMGQYDQMFDAIELVKVNFAHTHWFHYVCYLYYLYLGGKDYIHAKEHIEIAIAIDPTLAYYHRCLGELYLINREADKAEQSLHEAVRLDPNNAEFRSRYALSLLRLHKVDESVLTAESALKDGVDDPRVFDTVGMIYTLSGDLEKGEKLFREALRIFPTYDYFQKHIDWVLKERNDKESRLQQGKTYTPLYLRHTGTRRFF